MFPGVCGARAASGRPKTQVGFDGFIEFSEGGGLSESALVKLFDQHPLVQRELSFQEELFDLLRTAQRPSADTIKSLRELASDDGVSNIGICLEE